MIEETEKGYGFKVKVPTIFGSTAAEKGYNELWGSGIISLDQAQREETDAFKYLVKQTAGKEADPHERD